MINVTNVDQDRIKVNIFLDCTFELTDFKESITQTINNYLEDYLGKDVLELLSPEDYKTLVNRLIRLFLDEVATL